MTPETIENYVLLAAAVMGVASQIVAILGQPEWIEKIRPIKAVVDIIAGNYGKAKNQSK